MTKHGFLKAVKEISYYNSFLRVKEDLVDMSLISIDEETSDITLTEKGKQFIVKLKELNQMIEVK